MFVKAVPLSKYMKNHRADIVTRRDCGRFHYRLSKEEKAQLQEAALFIGKPCVFFVRDNEDDNWRPIVETGKCYSRFVVYNVRKTENGTLFLTVDNTGKGALTDYWFKEKVVSAPGMYI